MKRIYIISDLHLGGRPDARDTSGQIVRPGFQICHAYAPLTAFIDWVGREAEAFSGDTEIVINGDIVDFLADDDFDHPSLGAAIWTSNEADATTKLDRIIARTRADNPRGPFDALRDFVAKGGLLTLMLGNHDVELALPSVRRHLQVVLEARGGRLNLIYDGEAYVCGDLLIEHGNRYDPWNTIDHSALRQERSMLSRGLAVDENERRGRYFLAPAGTLMVIHLINHLKRQYRFVDLLKPETGAVIPLLLALNLNLGELLQDILALTPVVLWRKRRGRLVSPVKPAWRGNLKPGQADHLSSLDEVLEDILGKDAALFPLELRRRKGDLSPASGFLTRLNRLAEKARKISEAAGYAANLFNIYLAPSEQKRIERLHVALRILCADFSFDITREHPDYLEAATALIDTGKFSTVVFGHTHLPKQVNVQTDSGKTGGYLNTGTWADVIRLPEQIMGSDEAAAKALTEFIEAMSTNSFDSYVRRYLSYVEATLENNLLTQTNLYSFCGAGAEREAPLTEFR